MKIITIDEMRLLLKEHILEWMGDDMYQLIAEFATHSEYNQILYKSLESNSAFNITVPSRFVRITWFTDKHLYPDAESYDIKSYSYDVMDPSMYNWDTKTFESCRNVLVVKYPYDDLHFDKKNVTLDGTVKLTYINPKRSIKWLDVRKVMIFEII